MCYYVRSKCDFSENQLVFMNVFVTFQVHKILSVKMSPFGLLVTIYIFMYQFFVCLFQNQIFIFLCNFDYYELSFINTCQSVLYLWKISTQCFYFFFLVFFCVHRIFSYFNLMSLAGLNCFFPLSTQFYIE